MNVSRDVNEILENSALFMSSWKNIKKVHCIITWPRCCSLALFNCTYLAECNLAQQPTAPPNCLDYFY